MKRIGRRGMWSGLAAAALLCTLAPRAAAQGDGAIRGQILDVEGKPAANWTIQAVNDQGTKSETKTDDKGNFVIRGLRAGAYKVNIFIPTQQQPFVTQTRVQSGQEAVVDVNLKEVVEKQNPGYAEALKKQQEEKQKFESVKAHFSAGKAVLDQLKQARNDLQKAPTDQRDALKQKVADLGNQAITEFQTAQKAAGEKDPNQALFWASLGEAYDLAGRYDEAVNAYQQAVNLKPDNAGYYNNLGNVQAKAGKLDDARASYMKSAELDPANAATAWRNFGIVLYNSNRLAEAVEPLQKAIELDPKSAQTWYLLGASLVAKMTVKQVGDKQEIQLAPGTTEAYEKAIELDPNGPFGKQAKEGLEQLQQMAPGIQTKFTTKKKKS